MANMTHGVVKKETILKKNNAFGENQQPSQKTFS